jgi:RNA polymerase sigma-70 factor (ECF subfamily)
MPDLNTELGGSQQEFPRTTADLLRQLADPGTAARLSVVELLAGRYWKPVYCFLRLSYRKSNEDAKDLTQAFFAWLLERDLLGRFDPSRSTFRTFLKGILRNFAGNEHQAAMRLKRGGGLQSIGADVSMLPVESPAPADPDAAFEQAFLKDAVDRALGRVKARYQSGRRIVPFVVFEQYHFPKEGPAPTYAIVAKNLGIKESDVRNYLHEVREAIRAEVKAEFQSDGGEPPAELASLFKG